MTRKNGLVLGAAALLALGASACDPADVTDINANPNSPTTAPAPTLFTNATRNAVGRWMGGMNIRGFELLAQHFAEVQYPESDQYKRLTGGFTSGQFDATYDVELKDLEEAIRASVAQEEPGWYGPAMVMRTWTFGMLTDTYGDIPYSEALRGDEVGFGNALTPTYDAQQAVINDFFTVLNQATTDMAGAPANALRLGGADPIYGGSLAAWQRFSNSLRARYALRIVNVDRPKADAELRAAFNAPGGVFTSNAHNATFAWPGNGVYDNPWADNFEGRDDHRISERFLTVLMARNDPRISVFAMLPDRDTVETALVKKWCVTPSACYIALQNALAHGDAVNYVGYTSRPGAIFYPGATSYGTFGGSGASYPSYLMTYAEVAFIQAEAAERSLGGLTPAQAPGFYNAGIQASMEQWGITDAAAVAAYLAHPQVAYQGGTAGLIQIAVQKWIALYSDGAQAWAEFRRTCQPANLRPGPEAITDEIPRRFEYSSTENAVNATNVAAATQRQGEDQLETPVWWDTQRAQAPTYQAGCGVRP